MRIVINVRTLTIYRIQNNVKKFKKFNYVMFTTVQQLALLVNNVNLDITL